MPGQTPDLMSRVQALAPPPEAQGASPEDLMSRVQKVASGQQNTPPAATPTAPPQDPRAGIATGVMQGIGQTVGTVSGLLNKIPGIGETLAPKQGVNALESMSTPNTTAEKVGSGLESVAEFVMGDEALKGLSIASKLGIATKVAKLAEEYPTIAKALHIGMNSLRQGTVGAGEGLAKGESPKEAAVTGAEVAGTGAALDVGGKVIGKVAGAAKEGIKKALTTISPESVQPEIQGNIRSAVGNTATKSIAKTVEDAGDQAYAKAKSYYKVLDDATGGRVQRFDDRLKNIKRALDNLTGTEEDVAKEGKLLKAQKETEDAMQEAFDDAEKSGVDPKIKQQASDSFKKSQALYDLDRSVKQSTSGMRPDVGDAKAAAKNPEVTDPEKFFKKVNDLHRTGRLQDALGEKGADELLSKTNEGVVKYRGVLRGNEQIVKNQNRAKGVAKAVGYGAAGTVGLAGVGKVVKNLIP